MMDRWPRNASPRYVASLLDARTELPTGSQERFNGYGVIGLPFRSGHVLALRRLSASSIGPRYACVWHRTPAGEWTFYADIEPALSCARYFGSEIAKAILSPVQLEWTGPAELTVSVSAARLDWSLRLASTPGTRILNLIAGLPDPLLRSKNLLKLLAKSAGRMLDVGEIDLHGQAPSGQRFRVNPRLLWMVESSRARVGSEDLGEPGPLSEQARLGTYRIPKRGLFTFGQAFYEPFDTARHRGSRSLDPASLDGVNLRT